MKLKVYLEKQLQKAIDHQDEHPLSGSAAEAVKEAQVALYTYMKECNDYKVVIKDYQEVLKRG